MVDGKMPIHRAGLLRNNQIRRAHLELPDILDYDNEFGPEIICFLPTVFWLKASGLLLNRKVRIFEGMRSFYYFLEDSEIVYKPGPRACHPAPYPLSYIANRQEHYATASPFELYPDLRKVYANQELVFAKPLLVINNKYVKEWGIEPMNFIPLDELRSLVEGLKDSFQIVYLRPGISRLPNSYSDDANFPEAFEDQSLMDQYPEVIIFDDLLNDQKGRYEYNHLKNLLFANCFYFITSQGGGAHHCATFSGSLVIVLHTAGHEKRFAYSNGFYKYYANPSPLTLLCEDRRQIRDFLPILLDSHVFEGRIHLSSEGRKLAKTHLPPSFEDPTIAAEEVEASYLGIYESKPD